MAAVSGPPVRAAFVRKKKYYMPNALMANTAAVSGEPFFCKFHSQEKDCYMSNAKYHRGDHLLVQLLPAKNRVFYAKC